jgi:predicted Fe-Mo cluster-binding NifX family protein
MKVAVCSTGDNLDSQVDPRFGRCAYFLIVDTETMEFEAIPNLAATQASGAGIMAAQLVGSKGVQAVIAGNYGPNAFQALNAAGIKTYSCIGGTVRDAVEALKSGNLTPLSSPNVQAHFGMGGQMGRGCGMGRGQGMCRGQGRGRGFGTD